MRNPAVPSTVGDYDDQIIRLAASIFHGWTTSSIVRFWKRTKATAPNPAESKTRFICLGGTSSGVAGCELSYLASPPRSNI